MSGSLRLALAQLNPCVGDLMANAGAIVEAVAAAARGGARLVLCPEMVVTGYPVEDLALRGSFRRGAAATLEDLAAGLDRAGLGDVAVVVGSLGESDDGRPQNVAALLRGGRIEARYSKMNLPNYGVFDEYRIFEPGTSPCVIDVEGRRFLIVICEDIWRPCPPAIAQLAGQLDGILVLNGSPFEVGKLPARLQHARRWIAALRAPLAYVNLVGGQDDLVFDGGSFACDAAGRVCAQAARFVEETLFVDWPVTLATDRAEADALAVEDAGLELDGSEAALVYQALVLGVRDYCVKNGFTSVVLGQSGGIDSALVATISADAIGASNVVGVSMPSQYSSQHSKDDAAALAAAIGIDYRIHPITPLVEAFLAQLELTGVAAENLQARVRGVILMGLSNQEGHLVLAPGNKSELATGYSTIYGDAVGGFAPIKDVFKTQVWQLARWRNDQAISAGLTPPIPANSIDKPPSAELRPNQKDTDSLPDYDVLDQVLAAYVGEAHGRRELLAAGFDPDTVDLVLRLVDRAEWKRRQYPPGPKVSALAFGRDRRLPVTSRWREP